MPDRVPPPARYPARPNDYDEAGPCPGRRGWNAGTAEGSANPMANRTAHRNFLRPKDLVTRTVEMSRGPGISGERGQSLQATPVLKTEGRHEELDSREDLEAALSAPGRSRTGPVPR